MAEMTKKYKVVTPPLPKSPKSAKWSKSLEIIRRCVLTLAEIGKMTEISANNDPNERNTTRLWLRPNWIRWISDSLDGLTEIVDLGEMTKNTDIKLRGTELKGLSIYVPRHIRMSYDLWQWIVGPTPTSWCISIEFPPINIYNITTVWFHLPQNTNRNQLSGTHVYHGPPSKTQPTIVWRYTEPLSVWIPQTQLKNNYHGPMFTRARPPLHKQPLCTHSQCMTYFTLKIFWKTTFRVLC